MKKTAIGAIGIAMALAVSGPAMAGTKASQSVGHLSFDHEDDHGQGKGMKGLKNALQHANENGHKGIEHAMQHQNGSNGC